MTNNYNGKFVQLWVASFTGTVDTVNIQMWSQVRMKCVNTGWKGICLLFCIIIIFNEATQNNTLIQYK